MRGEYVPLSDVNKQWADSAGRVKTKLLGFPARFAMRLSEENEPSVISDILTEAVNEVLSELADTPTINTDMT